MDVSRVIFAFVFFASNFCSATVFNKVNGYIAIVGNGDADVQLEDDLIGLRILRESTCDFRLMFQDQHDSVTTLHVDVDGTSIIVISDPVNFDGSEFIDIFIASNGSVYCGNELMRNSLRPLNMDNENRVHFTASKIADGCYVPIVKGKIDESQLENRSAGEFSVWATVVIVVVIVAFIVGGILLITFHRNLLCFKRKPAPECDNKGASKMDSKLTQSKMQSVSKPKAVKMPSSNPPPPVPLSVFPSPSFSGPPTTLAPPRTDPSPSKEPSVAPSSATPPTPSNAASSRSTAKGRSKTRR